MKVITWLKENKLTALILLVLLFVLYKQYSGFGVANRGLSSTGSMGVALEKGAAPSVGRSLILPVPGQDFAPTESKDRLVVEESSLSLVVKDVRKVSDEVVNLAKKADGFMVSTSLTKPEEVPFATVVVRVPAEKFPEVLNLYRSLAIKVSQEFIQGTDVTDEYVDIEARLETLNKTKAKFEEIMNKAVKVEEILQVQREIIYLQDQIDALKGRQSYLEKTAALAKITVYLSTDELALPYAPTPGFRPGVIFKLAVRSLVLALRSFASLLIWVVVYAVVWLPLAAVVFFVWRWKNKKG